jgi:hypothetical protein
MFCRWFARGIMALPAYRPCTRALLARPVPERAACTRAALARPVPEQALYPSARPVPERTSRDLYPSARSRGLYPSRTCTRSRPTCAPRGLWGGNGLWRLETSPCAPTCLTGGLYPGRAPLDGPLDGLFDGPLKHKGQTARPGPCALWRENHVTCYSN